MADHPNAERAAELIEKRLHGILTPEEDRELQGLAELDRSVRADLDRSEQESQAMHAAFTESTPFDFGLARAAVQRKLATERRVVRGLLGSLLVTWLMMIAIMWPRPDWGLVAWCVGLPLAPMIAWSAWRWREAVRFRRAVREGPESAASAYAEHLRGARLELTISGAACALVSLGMGVWMIDMLIAGNWILAAVAALLAGYFVDTGVRRLWTRAARARHERFLLGEDDPD